MPRIEPDFSDFISIEDDDDQDSVPPGTSTVSPIVTTTAPSPATVIDPSLDIIPMNVTAKRAALAAEKRPREVASLEENVEPPPQRRPNTKTSHDAHPNALPWNPPMLRGTRPIHVSDSTDDVEVAFVLGRAAMLPKDLEQDTVVPYRQLMRSCFQHNVKSMQKMYVACDRAFTDNKAFLGENSKLMKEVESLKKTIRGLNKERDNVVAENNKLKEEVTATARRVNEAEYNFNDAMTRIGVLENKLTTMKTSQTKLESELASAKTEADDAYNLGVAETKEKLKEKMPLFEDLIWSKSWKHCLTKINYDRSSPVWTEMDLPSQRGRIAAAPQVVVVQTSNSDHSHKEASDGTATQNEHHVGQQNVDLRPNSTPATVVPKAK